MQLQLGFLSPAFASRKYFSKTRKYNDLFRIITFSVCFSLDFVLQIAKAARKKVKRHSNILAYSHCDWSERHNLLFGAFIVDGLQAAKCLNENTEVTVVT